MVDTEDMFRRLTSGAKFNRKRLNKELSFLRGNSSEGWSRGSGVKSAAAALDFFGDLAAGGSSRPAAPEERETRREREKGLLGKRKRKINTESDDESEEEEVVDGDGEGESCGGGDIGESGEEEIVDGDGGEGESCGGGDIGESGEEEIVDGDGGEGDGEGESCGGGDIGESREEEEGEDELEVLAGHSVVGGHKKKDKRKKKNKRKKRLTDVEKQSLLKREEANAFRNAHKIYVNGSDIPDAVASFDQLHEHYSLPAFLKKSVVAAGYHEPTPIQMQAIPLMLHGREVLACAPTGSGKTAAFIIPLLVHLKEPAKQGFRAVVVSPTRELAQQTYRECIRLGAGSGFKVHVLTKAKATANSFGPHSSQRFDILVTTPNRLVHMLSQEPPTIKLNNVEWLVLDEADKLFENSPNDSGFREQVAQIYSACDNPNVKHALFSATLGSDVEEFCQTYFTTPVRVIVGLKNTAVDAVRQELLFVGQESGKLLAMRNLVHKGFTPPLLVFVQSKERAKELFHELIYDGLNVEVIHADRTQAQRDNIIKSFRAGKIWVLICTDLMGRGIDFKGVNMVINYDFPPTAISYIHRIGRTGRAGRQGHAITFFTEDDAVNLRSIANVMRSSGCDVPEWMLKMKRPSKDTRKRLAQRPPKREAIKTATRYDLQRARKRKEMVLASKHRTSLGSGQ